MKKLLLILPVLFVLAGCSSESNKDDCFRYRDYYYGSFGGWEPTWEMKAKCNKIGVPIDVQGYTKPSERTMRYDGYTPENPRKIFN